MLSGDFMQPVAAPSLASPDPVPQAQPSERHESLVQIQRRLDAAHGKSLWRSISSCLFLDVSHRAGGPLEDFLAAVRSGYISSSQWSLLQQRDISLASSCSSAPQFWENAACVGVLRHSVRSIACLQRASHLAARARQRLIVCLAVDAPRQPHGPPMHDPHLLRHLCAVPSLITTQNLPGGMGAR